MKTFPIQLPFWGRVVLLVGLLCIAAGVGLLAYRMIERPTVLSLAVGTLDGEAGQTASIVASHFATTKASIRLKVEKAGTVLDAAKAFAAGHADLAVVRADVGDLAQARSVAVVAQGVVMLIAPPGSWISSITDLRGRTVGVVGGEVNRKLVEVLSNEYDLKSSRVVFKDIAPADARRAVQADEVSALLLVVPLTEKYLAYVRSLFRGGAPRLIPIDAAGAIADTDGAYESFDIPRGTLRGAPAVPGDDVTTLRVPFELVASSKLDAGLVANLTQMVIAARRDLVAGQPLLAGIAAADTDPDAYIPVHPGAAAYYNGTQQSFMDKYGDDIYLTPMVLGALASILAAAWRFLGVRTPEPRQATLNALCLLPRRIRQAANEAELASIEDEVDGIIEMQLAKFNLGDTNALDLSTLVSAAHRLDNLVHHRRAAFATNAPISPQA